MECSVSILVDLIDITKGRDEDTCDTRMTITCCSVKWRISIIVLKVRFTSVHEQDSRRSIMTLLAAQVKGREAVLLLEVRICFVFHQYFYRLTESLPCGLMQRCTGLKIILRVYQSPAFEQQSDDLDVSFT